MQIVNLNQIKPKVNDTSEKGEKITTKFEPPDDEDVVSKVYLDTILSRKKGPIPFIDKDYNEYNLRNHNKSGRF